jgi:hypothetical protein
VRDILTASKGEGSEGNKKKEKCERLSEEVKCERVNLLSFVETTYDASRSSGVPAR